MQTRLNYSIVSIIPVVVVLLLSTISVKAQNSESQSNYIYKLEDILRGSLKEKALKAGYTTDSIGHRMGRNPADPEFEIAYFFENRFEANLTTELDIPSVYRQRNKISKLQIGKSDAELRLERQNVLTDLSDKYLELIYNMKLQKFTNSLVDKDSIDYYQNLLKKSLEKGEITQLDYTDLDVIFRIIRSTFDQCETEIKNITNEIRVYNPNFEASYEDFPEFDFGSMSKEDFIDKAFSSSPIKEILLADSLISERELKLARLQWAPKFVLGVRLDMEENNKFAPAGVGGISLPLWENRGNVKHSKAKINQVTLERKSREEELIVEFENLYSSYITTKELSNSWKQLDIDKHAELLSKAYLVGRITSSDFYLKMYNLITNVTYVYELQQKEAAYAARMLILLNL